jgi:hypothetical protein
MDLDPWQEAAALAALPADAAAQRVAALFRAVPEPPLSDCDRDTVASRLITLLPRPTTSEITSPAAAASDANAIEPRPGTSAVFLAICVLVLLAFQFIMARPAPAPPVNTAHAPLSQTIPLPAPATEE